MAKEKEDEEVAGSIIFDEGQSVDVKNATSKESFTKPPKHFTDVILFESKQWKFENWKGDG